MWPKFVSFTLDLAVRDDRVLGVLLMFAKGFRACCWKTKDIKYFIQFAHISAAVVANLVGALQPCNGCGLVRIRCRRRMRGDTNDGLLVRGTSNMLGGRFVGSSNNCDRLLWGRRCSLALPWSMAIFGWDRKQLAAIFVLVFVSVSFMLYLASPAGTGGLPKLLELPLFVLVTIGSSVSPVLSRSITSIYFVVMALFVLTFAAAAVFVALTLDRKRTAKYVAIILFGAINVAAITVTRYQLGLENAASSRYSIFVAPIVIGTTGVFVVSFYLLRLSRYLYIAFFFSIAPSLLMANIQEQRTAIYRGAAFERMRQALMTESYRDNATLRTTFYVTDQDAQIVADMVEFMKQRRLNIFHGAGTRDAGDFTDCWPSSAVERRGG